MLQNVTTTRLADPSFTLQNYHSVVVMVTTCNIYSLSNLQDYNSVLLTTVNTVHRRFQGISKIIS